MANPATEQWGGAVKKIKKGQLTFSVAVLQSDVRGIMARLKSIEDDFFVLELGMAAAAGIMLGYLASYLVAPAHSAPACLSIAEARAAYPGKHLWWHTPAHCWNADRGRKFKGATKKPSPKPIRGDNANSNKAEKIQPAPHETTIWPFLITNAAAIDPQWFLPEQSTGWPRLLDVDELTSDTAPPECCWPPLEQLVAFNDRWQEVPKDWQPKPKGEAIWTLPIRN